VIEFDDLTAWRWDRQSFFGVRIRALPQAFDCRFRLRNRLAVASIGFSLIAPFVSSSDRLASPFIPTFQDF
jgi:hypothetical protein